MDFKWYECGSLEEIGARTQQLWECYANQIFLKEIGIRNDKDIVGNFDLRGGLGWSLYLNLF